MEEHHPAFERGIQRCLHLFQIVDDPEPTKRVWMPKGIAMGLFSDVVLKAAARRMIQQGFGGFGRELVQQIEELDVGRLTHRRQPIRRYAHVKKQVIWKLGKRSRNRGPCRHSGA
jgi:hypothetical protein